MKKHEKIRLWSIVGAVFLVMTGLFCVEKCKNMKLLQKEYDGYRQSVFEFSSGVSALEAELKKCAYASTAQKLYSISAEISRNAEAAKCALAHLPVSADKLENTNKFLSQVGNYALSVSAASSNGITGEMREEFFELSQAAKALSESALSLERTMTLGKDDIWAVDRTLELPEDTEPDGFSDMEDGMGGTPTLIYDGPFSDGILTKRSQFTAVLEKADEDEVRRLAQEIFECKAEDIGEVRREDSNMPAYVVYSADGEKVASFTEGGGRLAYYMDFRPVGEGNVSVGDGISAAEKILEDAGYTSMRTTYYEKNGDILTINFAFEDSGAVCYTEIIKVSVALDNGRICGVDARGYLMNHHIRAFPQKRFSSEDAAEKLNQSLGIISVKECFIPTDGGNERYAYEFLCHGRQGEKVLVYISPENCEELDILLLIENENGTLTK